MVNKEGTDQPDQSDPEHALHSDALDCGVPGAMKPLLPAEHKFRVSSTWQLW